MHITMDNIEPPKIRQRKTNLTIHLKLRKNLCDTGDAFLKG